MTPSLEAHQLGKTFAKRFPRREAFTALADVTFDVEPGEVFAFLGPNGAGKTTTINLLLGFLTPSHGHTRMFGLDPREAHARRRLGYLPENYAFYAAFDARTVLDYFGKLLGLARLERRRRINELLERVGLAEVGKRPIGNYSRGMRQRLGIAQALLNRPQLLILDEPTSGFDPLGRHMVRDLLSEARAAGTAIFLSSHILSEVESICDRVVILDRGRVVRQGTLADVVGAGKGFEVTFRDDEGHAEPAVLRNGWTADPAEGMLRLSFSVERDAQRALDVVRSHGGVIVGYRVVGRSLEDAFIENVGAGDDAPSKE